MTTKQAFLLGYEAGRTHGELSAREAYDLYPNLAITDGTITAFLNGTVDGSRGDTWRRNQP